jgi:hypothetical protein
MFLRTDGHQFGNIEAQQGHQEETEGDLGHDPWTDTSVLARSILVVPLGDHDHAGDDTGRLRDAHDDLIQVWLRGTARKPRS